MVAVELVIHGRVQGVFYRDWTVRNARELGLAGWVRNDPDGTVSACLEGEESAVEEMVGRMQSGPPTAKVESIERRAVEPSRMKGFARR